MTMLWLIFGALTVAILAILLVPFLGRGADLAGRRIDYDIMVYRDQLAEIAREIELGQMSDTQAESARAEIHRRMLAAEDAELDTAPRRKSDRRIRLIAAGVIAFALPVGAGMLYGALGSPNLPGEPYAWRVKHDPTFTAQASAAQFSAKLEADPTAAGYKHLAEIYFSARDFPKSAAAGRRAIALGANDADTWSALGEAVAMSNDAMVVPEALMDFTNALDIDPKDQRARFYIGLAEAQIGKFRQAVAIWRDLEKSAAPDAPWLGIVRDNIASFSKQGGFDPNSVTPAPPALGAMRGAVSAMTQTMHQKGGTAQPTAPAMPGAISGDQDKMIRAMVAQLADRMNANPGDADGWRRLAHAYNVLSEHGKARAAIDRAVRLKPKDVNVLLTLAETEKAEAGAGNETPDDFIATMRGVLKLDPANVSALYYVGIAEQKAGHNQQALTMWARALSHASADDPLAGELRKRINAATDTP